MLHFTKLHLNNTKIINTNLRNVLILVCFTMMKCSLGGIRATYILREMLQTHHKINIHTVRVMFAV